MIISQKTKRVSKIIGSVLIWLFVAFSVLVTVLAFAAQSNSTKIPTIGGKSMLTVQTPSMTGTFNQGDIIFINRISLADAQNLATDKSVVITFLHDINKDGKDETITHRIIGKDGDNYITKGDYNTIADNEGDSPFTVKYNDVIGVWNGGRLAGLGKVLDFFQKPVGFLCFIVIPMLAFFVYELIVFIKKLLQIKNKDRKVITVADEELIKKRAVEEYLKKQQEENEHKNDSTIIE